MRRVKYFGLILLAGLATGWPSAIADDPYPPSRQTLAQMTVRTSVLDQLARQTVVKPGTVSTRILDAEVRGRQQTQTTVRIRGQARSDMAQIQLVSCGTVSSSTVSQAPGARVASAGNHTYEIIKPVYFANGRLLTQPGHGTVNASTTTQAVRSVVSGMPLLGPLGDRIAWQETQRRRPLILSIVARQVADEVLPEVNHDVDEALADLNRGWSGLHQTLNSLLPEAAMAWESASTQQSVTVRLTGQAVRRRSPLAAVSSVTVAPDSSTAILTTQTQQDVGGYGVLRIPLLDDDATAAAVEPAAPLTSSPELDSTVHETRKPVEIFEPPSSAPPAQAADTFANPPTPRLQSEPDAEEAMVLLITEEFPNQILATPALQGLRISDAALQQALQMGGRLDTPEALSGQLAGLADMLQQLQDVPPLLFSLQLSDDRPIQIKFRDGQLTFLLAFRVIPRSAEPSGLVQLQIPLRGNAADDGYWTIQAAQVTALPLSNDPQAQQWSQLIQTQTNQLLSNIPPMRISRQTDLSGYLPQGPLVELYRIRSEAGQLRVSWRMLAAGRQGPEL